MKKLEENYIEAYKKTAGNEMKLGKTVKDLRVMTGSGLLFKERIDNVVTSSKVKSGLLLCTFATRQKEYNMAKY